VYVVFFSWLLLFSSLTRESFLKGTSFGSLMDNLLTTSVQTDKELLVSNVDNSFWKWMRQVMTEEIHNNSWLVVDSDESVRE
jgi:uncharacterized Zn finger protein